MAPEALAKDRLINIDTVRASRRSTDLARRLHRNWLMYYGLNDWKSSLSDNLYASGPNGERVELRANHARNIIAHMKQLTTSTRPELKAKAANMDIASLKQTQIADALIDHLMEFDGVWNYLDMAVEHALVLHGGFIHATWDKDKGEAWAAEPQLDDNPGMIAYQGDFKFSVKNLFDVVFNQLASSWHDVRDLTVRDWVNKYDLAMKYPKLETDIMRQKSKREWEVYDALPMVFFSTDESDEIEVHTYYHDRTPAVPHGRQISFLSDGTVLEDGALQYVRKPVFRIAAGEIMGTPHAWCPLTDLASLQESINKSLSTVATNQFAFGVQNIWAPRGSRLEVNQLSGGLNLIEGSPVGPNGGKPEVLELLKTPKEIFDFYEIQTKVMETLSGVNQVVRGNPEPGLTAGVALALVSTQSIQFMSELQRSYAEAARDLMMFCIDTLKEKATTPRMLHMIGSSKRELVKYFQGGDIEGVNRVSYELGNPMARTTAGRMQLAQMVIETGVMLNPNQILEIVDKGRLEPMTKGSIDQLDNILLENEDLRNGIPVPVLAGDDDRLHLQEQIVELQNPDIRRNLMAQQVLMQHLMEHVQKYMTGDIIRGIIEGAIPPPYAMPPPAPGGPGGKPGGPPHGAPAGHPPPHGGQQRKPPPAKNDQKAGVPRVVLPNSPGLPQI